MDLERKKEVKESLPLAVRTSLDASTWLSMPALHLQRIVLVLMPFSCWPAVSCGIAMMLVSIPPPVCVPCPCDGLM
jgi:hypothetical protein